MEVKIPGIDEAVLVTLCRFGNDHGCFTEMERLSDGGGETQLQLVQDNHSFSQVHGGRRGLHYQSPAHAQNELLRRTRGMVLVARFPLGAALTIDR